MHLQLLDSPIRLQKLIPVPAKLCSKKEISALKLFLNRRHPKAAMSSPWKSAPLLEKRRTSSSSTVANHGKVTSSIISKSLVKRVPKVKITRQITKLIAASFLASLLVLVTLINTEFISPTVPIKSAKGVLGNADPLSFLLKQAQQDQDEDNHQDYVQSYSKDDLRYKLAKKFPYNRKSTIPKEIWQTWKESVEEITNANLLKYVKSWTQQDEYNYHLVTDDQISLLVQQLYADFPEITETLDVLPKSILKFDFLRYLLLFAKGGVYSDIDTVNVKPLNQWIDSSEPRLGKLFHETTSSDIGFVVGIEGDYDRPDWRYKMARRLQFCQWTFKSKIGHPILRELIYNIVDTTLNRFDQRLNHVSFNGEYHTLHSIFTILNWTGPGVFTDMIFDHFNRIFKSSKFINNNEPPVIRHKQFEYYHRERNEINIEDGKFIGWSNFTKIAIPVLYDDVLVMPINSFNAYNEIMEIKANDDFTYVKHDFSGSWKNL